MKKFKFFDSTLRDGSHAIKHSLTKENIASYCTKMDEAGMEVIIVGHGNGLGASSLQGGLSLLSDVEMLDVAKKNLRKTHLGAFLTVGFGTIKDDIVPALEAGVDLVCVATHCTEANIAKQYIEFLVNEGKKAYGVLLMYHMTSTERLVVEALKMQKYGADGVIVMDTAGASTPDLVAQTIRKLKRALTIEVGFHPHNNLGMAVGNAYLAYICGADFIDATIRGFGAGAGNCQLEAFAALMQSLNIETGIDLFRLLDVGDSIVDSIWENGRGLSSVSIVSGMSGINSTFGTHVNAAAKQYKVDPKSIFLELGKLRVVGGQEDIVVEVAMNLAQRTKDNITEDIISSLL